MNSTAGGALFAASRPPSGGPPPSTPLPGTRPWRGCVRDGGPNYQYTRSAALSYLPDGLGRLGEVRTRWDLDTLDPPAQSRTHAARYAQDFLDTYQSRQERKLACKPSKVRTDPYRLCLAEIKNWN